MNRRTTLLAALALALLLGSGWPAGPGFAAENRGLAVPANLLPAELKPVPLQDRFLPAGTREAGVLQTVVGHVVVARGDLSQAYAAASGDRLFEQDIIFTLKDGRCRIKLANDDIITLGDGTRLTLKEAAGSRGTAEKKSVLALARGKAMFYALRLLNHTKAEMTVESPTAVTGVRGTKFGVEVTLPDNGARAERAARPLLLADASADWARHLIVAQAGPPAPAGGTTTVHGFEGTVVVTSILDGRTQTVGAGQTVSTTPQGMGALMPTPPQVSQRFQSITNVPPPGGAGSGGTGGGGSGAGGGTSGGQPQGEEGGGASSQTTGEATTTPLVADTASITQQQTTSQTEQAATQTTDPVSDPKTNASGSHVGYFAGILTNLSTGGPQDVYVSQNRYSGDGNVWGRGIINAEDYLRVEGGGGFSNPVLKWAQVFGKSSGALEKTVYHQPLGSYSDGLGQYMEWGWATIPSFVVDGKTYEVDNQAFWIFGKTPEAGLSFAGTYSGGALGTYWTSAGGTSLSGSFSCDVNLTGGTGSVSNFVVDVSGGGVSAIISGASGTIGGDSHFNINPATGFWNLNGATPAQGERRANGSLYGSQAAGIGGVWGMSTGSGSAAGIFHGTRP